MRLALLSDIHGNRLALETVLADAQTRHVSGIVSLGDVAALGPEPGACIDLLASINADVIMGNTDAALLQPPLSGPVAEERYRRFAEIERWCAAQLNESQRQTLASYQPALTIPLGTDADLLAYHGSPRSYDDAIVATTPYETLAPWFADTNARVYAGGHTHQPFVRRYYEAFILNPGSVGLAFVQNATSQEKHNISCAEYAIIEYDAGQVVFEMRRLNYDGRAVVRTAIARGMPYAEWWGRDL